MDPPNNAKLLIHPTTQDRTLANSATMEATSNACIEHMKRRAAYSTHS